jgi:uncharacterized damage-inducible protein DinB
VPDRDDGSPACAYDDSRSHSNLIEGKNMIYRILPLVLMIVSSVNFSWAQNSEAAPSSDKTAPSYDMKAQSLVDLERVQKKFADLLDVLPADKLNWRPSSDSRSFAELFLHVAGERYGILRLMGATPPADYDGKKFEKSTTEKAQIAAELARTWDFAQKSINGMTNVDFAKLMPKLGPQANAGDVVYILVADAHEHLGQAVAYARMNGVVPPWTVEAQKKAAEKKADDQKKAGQN